MGVSSISPKQSICYLDESKNINNDGTNVPSSLLVKNEKTCQQGIPGPQRNLQKTSSLDFPSTQGDSVMKYNEGNEQQSISTNKSPKICSPKEGKISSTGSSICSDDKTEKTVYVKVPTGLTYRYIKIVRKEGNKILGLKHAGACSKSTTTPEKKITSMTNNEGNPGLVGQFGIGPREAQTLSVKDVQENEAKPLGNFSSDSKIIQIPTGLVKVQKLAQGKNSNSNLILGSQTKWTSILPKQVEINVQKQRASHERISLPNFPKREDKCLEAINEPKEQDTLDVDIGNVFLQSTIDREIKVEGAFTQKGNVLEINGTITDSKNMIKEENEIVDKSSSVPNKIALFEPETDITMEKSTVETKVENRKITSDDNGTGFEKDLTLSLKMEPNSIIKEECSGNRATDIEKEKENKGTVIEIKDKSCSQMKYFCSLCFLHSNDKKRITSHVKLSHEVTQCRICEGGVYKMVGRKKPQKRLIIFQCTNCHHCCKSPQALHKHDVKHKKDSRYYKRLLNQDNLTCDECKTLFMSEAALKRHQVDHRRSYLPANKKMACETCGKMVKGGHMKDHLRTHSDVKAFSCGICEKTFKHPSGLYLHTREIHSAIKPFVCPHPNCNGLAFKRKQRLQIHLANIHGAPKKYPCPVCFKGYNTKRLMQDHYRSVHSKETPWACRFCTKCFSWKQSWVDHEKKHKHGRIYVCEKCGRGFFQKVGLRKHLCGSKRRIGGGRRPVYQEESHSFKSTNMNLRHHVGRNQSEGTKGKSARIERKSTQKSQTGQIFSCHVCYAIFATGSSFKQHMKSHDTNNVNTCTVCQQSFTSPAVLREHLQSHREGTKLERVTNPATRVRKRKWAAPVKKEFACNRCRSSFMLESTLIKHRKIHFTAA